MSVLESVPTEPVRTRVFRLASHQPEVDFLREQGFDAESTDEMRELLRSRGIADSPEELCDGPFRYKPRLQKAGHATRFSDGSFPVFYSSLEVETAEAEIRYWFPEVVVGKPTRQRTAYYSRFACDFNGATKDLRPKQADWPELTHGSDYRFCNRLGAEAVAMDLDGLLAPSARRPGGTSVPVFTRRAISHPLVQALVAVTLDPSSGEVSLNDG